MTMHFIRELEKMKKTILTLGGMVEERLHMAKESLNNKDVKIAEKIINSDHEIDEMEVDIEEECLKILALYQPVAVDLRFLIGVIKINNDLERIADQAKNVGQRVKTMAKYDGLQMDFDYTEMANTTTKMLKMSLDALVNLDPNMAREVCRLDDEVDDIKNSVYEMIKSTLHDYPDHVGYLLNFFLVSRHLERIADHATNIAEEVIYLSEGQIVRHTNFIK